MSIDLVDSIPASGKGQGMDQPIEKPLSMRQYAKRRGVSPEAVSKAVKTGRISTVLDADGNRKINPEIADREWSANTDPSQLRSQRASPESPAALMEENPMSFNDAKALRERYRAELSRLEFERESEKLVDAEAVKERWTSLASSVRTKVLGIPSKAKQRCPDMTADHVSALEMIVRECLEDLADGGS